MSYQKKIDKPMLVAEIGMAHEGSLGLAMSMAKKAKECGADAVKFQYHISEYESSKFENFRKKFSLQDNSRFDYWKRTSFTINEWKLLRNFCKKINLNFICSAFSLEAAKNLNKIGIDYWKISSGEFTNMILLEYIVKNSNKPIILSTGLADQKEIKKIINFLKRKKKIFFILQCTSKYPAKLEEVGHKNILRLKKKYDINTGLSDHSGNINSLISAIFYNAEIIEFHVTYDKSYFGPDTNSSILFSELKLLSEFKKDFEKIKNTTLLKNIKANKKTQKIFKKSIYARKDIKSDSKLKMSDIIALKPLKGISALNYKKILGKKLKKNVKKGDPIKTIFLKK